jgi:hypothetical protein
MRPVVVLPDARAVVIADWLVRRPFFFRGLAEGDAPVTDRAVNVLLNADLMALPTSLMDDRDEALEDCVRCVEGGPCEEFSANEELLMRKEPSLRNGVGDGGVELSSSSLPG